MSPPSVPASTRVCVEGRQAAGTFSPTPHRVDCVKGKNNSIKERKVAVACEDNVDCVYNCLVKRPLI